MSVGVTTDQKQTKLAFTKKSKLINDLN